MPRIRDGLSMRHNGKQWIASYRLLDGAWGTWRAPSSIGPRAVLEAERHFLARYEGYLGSGVQPTRTEVRTSAVVTLTDIAPRWLEYRASMAGTGDRYLASLDSQWRTHIEGRPIAKVNISDIDDHDILTWIHGLHGKPATRLTVASTLSVMITDCIIHNERWGLPAKMMHPMFVSPAIKKALGGLHQKREDERVKPNLDQHQAETLLTFRNLKIEDVRRVKYCLRIHTGVREEEAEGLIFTDWAELPMPHIHVRRALLKGGALPFRMLEDVKAEYGNTVVLSTLPFAVCGPPKKGSRRALPLLPVVVETLKWWRAEGWRIYVGRDPEPGDPIFPSGIRNSHQPKGQFCKASAGHLMQLDLERCGLSTIYTSPNNGLTQRHDSRTLRRTFASLLGRVGVDEHAIGDLLGHGALTVTGDHYIDRVLQGRLVHMVKLPIVPHVAFKAHEIDLRESTVTAPVVALRRGQRRDH